MGVLTSPFLITMETLVLVELQSSYLKKQLFLLLTGLVQIQFPKLSKHHQDPFFSISDVDKIGDTTSALCNRNFFLAVGYYDDDDFVPVFKSSPASVLSVSVAFVFAVVIAALAI